MGLGSMKNIAICALFLFITALIFVTTRHIQLVASRKKRQWAINGHIKDPELQSNDYFLFVLGSGGHTKEMLMMMDDGFCNFSSTHRRYLISSGDKMSENHLLEYESELKDLCGTKSSKPGTYDTMTVTRARRVHQPLWSTPFTGLASVVGILPVLLSAPKNETGKLRRYPSQIFSNGPATAFFVALTVHLLKMLYLVPENSMKFVYIESWARISTLSLTGKLLYFTGTADLFLVQHAAVASKYGLQNAGEMVFNARRDLS